MSILTAAGYLPHDTPMVLLENVVSVTEETAICDVVVSPDGVLAPFLNARGALPAGTPLNLLHRPSASGAAGTVRNPESPRRLACCWAAVR